VVQYIFPPWNSVTHYFS